MIIVANDVPSSLFTQSEKQHNKILEHWKVPDTEDTNIKEQDRIAELIKKRVKKLML